MVVPIFAPRTTQSDCFNVNRPALTSPTVITVVAELDWISAVTNAPVMTATTRRFVSTSRRLFSFWPAAFFRPSDMSPIPNRKRPNPPIVPKIPSRIAFRFWSLAALSISVSTRS